MKRILLALILLVIFTPIFCQTSFYFCKYINGYWGKWENSNPYTYIEGGYLIKGNYDEFIIYDYNNHPSQYIMKVKLFAMDVETDKKLKKQRIKSGQWYEYSGTVEYYTQGLWDKFKNIMHQWPNVPDASNGEIQTASATIKIQPYKKRPEVYNIFFENIGLGIQFK